MTTDMVDLGSPYVVGRTVDCIHDGLHEKDEVKNSDDGSQIIRPVVGRVSFGPALPREDIIGHVTDILRDKEGLQARVYTSGPAPVPVAVDWRGNDIFVGSLIVYPAGSTLNLHMCEGEVIGTKQRDRKYGTGTYTVLKVKPERRSRRGGKPQVGVVWVEALDRVTVIK